MASKTYQSAQAGALSPSRLEEIAAGAVTHPQQNSWGFIGGLIQGDNAKRDREAQSLRYLEALASANRLTDANNQADRVHDWRKHQVSQIVEAAKGGNSEALIALGHPMTQRLLEDMYPPNVLGEIGAALSDVGITAQTKNKAAAASDAGNALRGAGEAGYFPNIEGGTLKDVLDGIIRLGPTTGERKERAGGLIPKVTVTMPVEGGKRYYSATAPDKGTADSMLGDRAPEAQPGMPTAPVIPGRQRVGTRAIPGKASPVQPSAPPLADDDTIPALPDLVSPKMSDEEHKALRISQAGLDKTIQHIMDKNKDVEFLLDQPYDKSYRADYGGHVMSYKRKDGKVRKMLFRRSIVNGVPQINVSTINE